jgi:hypothetical protein
MQTVLYLDIDPTTLADLLRALSMQGAVLAIRAGQDALSLGAAGCAVAHHGAKLLGELMCYGYFWHLTQLRLQHLGIIIQPLVGMQQQPNQPA